MVEEEEEEKEEEKEEEEEEEKEEEKRKGKKPFYDLRECTEEEEGFFVLVCVCVCTHMYVRTSRCHVQDVSEKKLTHFWSLPSYYLKRM